MIDTDTRQLRRLENGMFKSGAGKIPCDHCGFNHDCALQPLETCPHFLPTIPFMDETGLDKIANTMRVGKAWTKRLRPDDTIALYHVKEQRIFGHSRVLHTSCGPIEAMLKAHAPANHLMLDTPFNEAPAILGAWMLQNYGPRIITETTTLTAVYLLRIGEPPLTPNQQGLEAARQGRRRTPRNR